MFVLNVISLLETKYCRNVLYSEANSTVTCTCTVHVREKRIVHFESSSNLCNFISASLMERRVTVRMMKEMKTCLNSLTFSLP